MYAYAIWYDTWYWYIEDETTHTCITGGCGNFVQLIIKFRRIYAGMNESSGTPRYACLA
jgi:hypothetical protein